MDSLTSPSGLFIAAVLVIMALPVTRTIQDPDFWWHLRAGQLIIQHAGLLGNDPFTYTVPTHHWTMHEWLNEVLFAVEFAVGGLGLIVLVLSAVTWLGLLAVMQKARLRHPSRGVLGLGMLVAVVAGFPIWGPRVQMITFAFSALTLFLVERYMVRGGKAMWLLVPVFVLWSNLHGEFVIGLGFIVVILVAELAGERLHMPDPAPRSRLLPILYLLIACTAVSMINLNGPTILFYAAGTQASTAQQSLIEEWFSPSFHDWEVLVYGAMLLSLAILIVFNQRIRARDVALVLVTTALSLQSARHIELFVAVSTPVYIDQLELATPRIRAALRRLRRAPAPARPRTRAQPPLLFRLAACALLMAGLGGVYVAWLVPKMQLQPYSLAYAQEFPVCAAQWLAGAPEPLKIFNQYGEGGYLAEALSSHGDKVFIFGDAALMGDQMLETYANVETVTPSWDSIIRRFGTDIVLYDIKTPLADVMDHAADWTKVYQDGLSVAFVPTDRLSTLQLPPVPHWAPGSVCAEQSKAGANAGAQNQ
ncbi:MAG: hypothetical protein ACYDCS_04930 [Candidatus Dormibacteria bacterium]